MLVKQTSLSLVGSRFLGSKDHILLAGNATNNIGRLQVNYCQYRNGQDGIMTLNAVADSVIHQQISCVEVISIPRLSKSFIAVAGQHQDFAALSFIDIALQQHTAEMKFDANHVFNTAQMGVQHFPRITSMSYLADRECLAVATEAGDIAIFDLYSAKHVVSIRADATGINKIQFTPNGQIVSVGNSVETPMKIFDLRQDNSTTQITPACVYTRKQNKNAYKANTSSTTTNKSAMDIVSDEDPYERVYNRSLSLRAPGYTTVTSHPSQDKVMAADSTGHVILWDLRTSSSIEYHPHGSVGKYNTMSIFIFTS